MLNISIWQVKGLVAQLIQVKDVSSATGLEVTAGGKVRVCFEKLPVITVFSFLGSNQLHLLPIVPLITV